jgi:dipeptidyl aminopeptidase/acylaminoacyl peptidase
MRKTLLTSVVSIFVAAAFAASAAAAEYLDALFAPADSAELSVAYERITYMPTCKGYETIGTHIETPDYILSKVAYESDGLRQTGMMGFPKGVSPAPLIMLNHAGFSGITKFDIIRIVQFLERGYAVAVATYRGEGGLAGRAEGDMDIIGDESRDVLNLLECAAGLKEIDSERIAMVGVSHGGGLTISALTQTRRPKAAAIVSAPTNLTNDNLKEMAARWRASPASVEVMLQMLMPIEGVEKMKRILGVKEKNASRIPASRAEMLRRSPALFAKHIECPVMMWYGGQDPVAIWTDGKIIESSLKERGLFSKVTVFENRHHSYNPDEIEEVFEEILTFFGTTLEVGQKQ